MALLSDTPIERQMLSSLAPEQSEAKPNCSPGCPSDGQESKRFIGPAQMIQAVSASGECTVQTHLSNGQHLRRRESLFVPQRNCPPQGEQRVVFSVQPIGGDNPRANPRGRRKSRVRWERCSVL